MTKDNIINKLKRNKAALENQFNISKIGLFGSYSTGKSSNKSDIDLIFELRENQTLGLNELYQMELFFKKLFGEVKIDLVNQKYINPIVEDEIKKTVIYV